MEQCALSFDAYEQPAKAVSPFLEMGAYEALWEESTTTFKSLAQMFRHNGLTLPSDHVAPQKAIATAEKAVDILRRSGVERFGVRVHRAGEYPQSLRDARNPVELLYYRGWWELVETPCVAVVGTRNPSDAGRKRARKLGRLLVQHGYTVVAGLAAGIDTEAHWSTINSGGKTIAVLGTPLSHAYPSANKDLQDFLATQHLVISQVPVIRYDQQPIRLNRFFFPERNITMSALTMATIIVEAGETSGTLIQARAALQQNRKLFILDNCFQNPNLTWPSKLEARGAIRIRDFEDIVARLER